MEETLFVAIGVLITHIFWLRKVRQIKAKFDLQVESLKSHIARIGDHGKRPIITNALVSDILSNIENHASYYTGGSLCIDIYGDVLIFDLNGRARWFTESTPSIPLNNQNAKVLFEIYRKNKGETDYYREQITKFNF